MTDKAGLNEASAKGARYEDNERRTKPDDRLSAIRPELWLALLLLLVMGVYLGALEGEFVWDDQALVAGVERTLAGGSPWRIFAQPFWATDELDVATRGYYRPLTTLSFAFDWLVHHRNSTGFRLTNLALHLLNTVMLWKLCQRENVRPWLAAALVACWALQPRLAESVAWISGRTDVLCGSFSLGALSMWRNHGAGRAKASLGLLLALLAKETALATVLAVVLLDLSSAPNWRDQWKKAVLPPALALVVFLLLRQVAMAHRATLADPLEFWSRPRVALEALGTYAYLLVNPWQPSTQIGSVFDPNWLAIGAGGVIASVAMVVLYRRGLAMRSSPWLVLLVLPLVLVSHVVPIAINVVAADRFLYLPTMGLVLLASRHAWFTRSLGAVAALLLAISFLPVTTQRAPDWADPIALWTKTNARASSRNGLSLLELGNLEFEVGNFERAHAMFSSIHQRRERQAMAVERARTNLAIAAVALGRYREAQTIMEGVVAEHPRVPKFWYDLGTIQLRNGEFAAARKSFDDALRLWPEYTEVAELLRGFSSFEAAHRSLVKGELPIVERAELRTRLGYWREAERDWVALLTTAAPPSESMQTRALSFVLEHGSAAAVVTALEHLQSHPSTRSEFALALESKRARGERLARIPLGAYGVTP